jgi:hypothetical protein
MLATDSVYAIWFGAYFEVALIAHQRTSREQDARRNFGVKCIYETFALYLSCKL